MTTLPPCLLVFKSSATIARIKSREGAGSPDGIIFESFRYFKNPDDGIGTESTGRRTSVQVTLPVGSVRETTDPLP